MATTTDAPTQTPGRTPRFVRLGSLSRQTLVAERPKQRGRIAFWLALGWLMLIVLLAVFADLLPIKGYDAADFSHVREAPGLRWPEPLGTDALGRSQLSRLIHGARVSLAVGFLSVAIGLLVGTTLGVLAGYFRRAAEGFINVLTNTLLAIPPLVLLLVITVVMTPSLRSLVIGLAVLSIPTFVRLARANTMTLAHREFVSAAIILGAPSWRVLCREIVPNVLLPVSAFAVEIVGVLIMAESSLSFLKLGVPPPQPSWGGMIADGQVEMQTAPQLILVPIVALFLTVFAFKVVGDRLRAKVDVREALL